MSAKVVFACVHNAGRSQMASAYFNVFADSAKAMAISAGTEPAAHVHPEVLEVMREEGIDLADAKPNKLTPQLAKGSRFLITMGCGESCPVVPGARREDWPLQDPKGKGAETARRVRDEIKQRVLVLLAREGWARG
jgi:arsenate reductase